MSAEYKKYPICDADMWVNMCLTGLCERVFLKYGKLIFADVVEQELLAWERNDDKYKKVATNFIKSKSANNILIINHKKDLSKEVQEILENSLKDLNFKHGLLTQEKNKGEFVSALYADHFEIPFMKTNDSAFQDGGEGKKEFPDLSIKNWYMLVEEVAKNSDEKIRIRSQLDISRKGMNRSFERQKQERKAMQLSLLQEKN